MSDGLARLVAAGIVLLAVEALAGIPSGASSSEPTTGRALYVRQTVGNDANDGLSPDSAWQSFARLSGKLRAGDTVYVGPGLYREELLVDADGTAERPIRLLADPQGLHTGDPPGVVMVTGAESVDETIFSPHPEAGVYSAPLPEFAVAGVVEMDGPQFRYVRSRSTEEHLGEGLSEIEAVVKLPASYHYDPESEVLYLHTSDGRPPAEHEIELMRRGSGITLAGRSFVVVAGFTFRHTGDAGIKVSDGSTEISLIDNTSYGSRQGIRVRGSSEVAVIGSRLFRNENSGVYFLAGTVGGKTIDNTLYENAKGMRWSSESDQGLAVGNTAFQNFEAGASIERTAGSILLNNRFIENRGTQLLSVESSFVSEGNCFTSHGPEQLVADLSYSERFHVLSDYRSATGQDLGSRQTECGLLPDTTDVSKLHAETRTYLQRARRTLRLAD